MVRVLLVAGRLDLQDSIARAVESDNEVEIIGTARNGAQAVRMTKDLRPDLVVMGTHLQSLDTLEATKEIMIEAPTPIVLVFNTPDPRAVELSMLALEAGALAVIPAPLQTGTTSQAAAIAKFLSTLKAMSQVKVVRRWRDRPARTTPSARRPVLANPPARIVGIAASTGGPAALEAILTKLPQDFPAPVLVVQHITPGFINGVATWLDGAVPLKVKVAGDGELLQPHVVYLAPDGHHLGVRNHTRIEITDEAPINGFRPSGSYLFESISRAFGAEALGVILTGMGDDGALGLRALHDAGGSVLAQDETSSVVFGMPKVVIDAGITHRILPLDEIAPAMINIAGRVQWDR